MYRNHFVHWLSVACATGTLLLAGPLTAHAQQVDPAYYGSSQPYADASQMPGRVARLAYRSGQVQFAPAGEDDWGSVDINRPMVIGDRLLTGSDGLAALELGDAAIRIDHDSAFDFLNLDQGNVQVELAQGTLNLAVRQLAEGEYFEIDTPTIAFVALEPGTYRIDNDPDGTGSMVTVFRGSGIVYGANGASRQVQAGTSYRIEDSSLAVVEVTGLPEPDDFDRFCETRDNDYQRYAQREQQYVSPYMVGGDELERYGRWNTVPEYGNVWYPDSVPTGWAPYRYGHWTWIDPWGWTWVDDQPWGFAPSHYGRWAYIGSRWGWIPGPVNVRPVYAPALVAFIGGAGYSLSVRLGNGPVGWFPLGPRDVYIPWFHASRRYFDRVNVTNIRNVYVNQTVISNIYGDYHHGRYDNIHRYNRYAYRDRAYAVTAVPRDVFADARPVHPAVLKLDRDRLAGTHVAVQPGVNPGRASLGVRNPSSRPAGIRAREPFAQPIVARRTPPPRQVEFAAREKMIAAQGGRPLTTTQLRNLRRQTPVASNSRDVRLTARQPVAATPARSHRAPPAAPFRNTVHPIPARQQPVQPAMRPGELAGARFAHPEKDRTLPRPPVIRSANEVGSLNGDRLPVVPRVEPERRTAAQRAPQGWTSGQRGDPPRVPPRNASTTFQTQAQRQAQVERQQHAQAQRQAQAQREQQVHAQRQAQVQRERQVRAQQLDRQREVPMQGEQRARMAQLQQQRERQVQGMDRARQPSMQQQRFAQARAESYRQQRPVQPQSPSPRQYAQPAFHADQPRQAPPRRAAQAEDHERHAKRPDERDRNPAIR